MDRRSFLKNAAFAAALATLPTGAEALVRKPENKPFEPLGKGFRLAENDIILFTGDSITDGSRERKYYRLANHIRALGNGYVQLTATRLNYLFPQKNLKVYNTGVNGDTVPKFAARLETDCIKLKPSVISILLGVNDFNAAFSATGQGDPEGFEQHYRDLLTRIRRALPSVRFILGEPYAVKGAREKIDAWYPGFEAYPRAVRKLAEEFDAVLIPYQNIYARAAAEAPPRHYSTDGVHPSLAGVRLMSDGWLSHVNPR